MALHPKDDTVAALDRDHSNAKTHEPWPNFYARHLRDQFASS